MRKGQRKARQGKGLARLTREPKKTHSFSGKPQENHMISPDPFRSVRKRASAGAALAALLLTQGSFAPARAAESINPIENSARMVRPQPAGSIRFTATVPLVTQPLPLFALTPTQAPVSLLSDHLATLKAPKLAMEHEVFAARDAKTELLRAYVDPKTGDAELLPNLSTLITQKEAITPEAATETARVLLNNPAFLPKDDTTYHLAPVLQVNGGAATRPTVAGQAGTGTPAAVRLTFVPTLRYAAGLPVYGSGSHLAIAVDNNKTVQGFIRRWSSAKQAENIAPTLTAEQVQQSIREQLKAYAGHATVTVDRIVRAYYDGNGRNLQPVTTSPPSSIPSRGKPPTIISSAMFPLRRRKKFRPSRNKRDPSRHARANRPR
jgi:hypothetical protein